MDCYESVKKEVEEFKSVRGELIFNSVAEVFISDIPADNKDLEIAVGNENFEGIAEAAHKLHGILSMLFLNQSAEIIQKIKKHSENKSIRVINALLKVYQNQSDTTIKIMKEML